MHHYKNHSEEYFFTPLHFSVSTFMIFLKLLLITMEVIVTLLKPADMNMRNHSQNNKEEKVAGSLFLRI